jgi:hypothetical protein
MWLDKRENMTVPGTYFAPGQQSWIMSVLGQLIIFCPRPKNISAPKQRNNIHMLMTDRHNVRILHLERTKNPRIKHIHTTLTA